MTQHENLVGDDLLPLPVHLLHLARWLVNLSEKLLEGDILTFRNARGELVEVETVPAARLKNEPATVIDRVLTGAAALLFVGAIVGGLALWLGPTRPHQRLLLIWGLFSLAAIAGFREFAQVVPSLALLAAVAIGRLWDAASRDGLGLGRPTAGRVSLVALLGTIFLLSSSFQLIEVRRGLLPG